MRIKNFKIRIILPAVLVVVVLTAVLAAYSSTKFLNYCDVLINERIDANTRALHYFIENCRANSKAAATSMACNPKAVNAIKSLNREQILEIFIPTQDLYQISYYTVTDGHGVVLARTQAPEDFGDSVLSQPIVQQALAGQDHTCFESSSTAKVSICTGVPVYDTEGTLIGTISAGVRYDTDDLVDWMKQQFNSDITVFFGDTRAATTVTDTQGKRITGSQMPPHIAKVVLEGKQEFYGDVKMFGLSYKALYMPLINSNGEVFGVIFFGFPMTELKWRAESLIWNTSIISVIGVVFSIVVLYWAVSAISAPLNKLSREMSKMEAGRLSVVISPGNDDEIGHAGQGLQRVADTLLRLINDISITIAEHEKGNTDYRLDVSHFQGKYRLLADHIATLSSRGMEDQLTKLPNRRSFDNRLQLEWSRSVREKVSLSVLMLDLDHFKIYNDTYGHLQGDVALRMIANVLRSTIKRGYDFAARWGGEEFVILLPGTDSAGAMKVAESIRATAENMDISHLNDGHTEKITVSIGVCTLIPSSGDTVENLVARADKALYRAKETGRNSVCQYSDQDCPD